MPDASPRSVVGSSAAPPPGPPPASRQVSQSCGSTTRCTRAALAGSFSASQRSLVTVNDIVGTDPVARRPLGRPAELRDQRRRLRRGLHVVPEHRVPDDRAGVVERHHAVLLRPDADRGRPLEQAAARPR